MEPFVGQLIILITTALGFWYQDYAKRRDREWDLKDREASRKALAEKVEDVKTKTEEAHNIVMQKIEENTEMNRTAINEANNFNQKMLALELYLNSPLDRKAANVRQRETDKVEIRQTEAMVENTHAVEENTKALIDTQHLVEEKLS